MAFGGWRLLGGIDGSGADLVEVFPEAEIGLRKRQFADRRAAGEMLHGDAPVQSGVMRHDPTGVRRENFVAFRGEGDGLRLARDLHSVR